MGSTSSGIPADSFLDRTLVELLRHRAAHRPTERVYTFLYGDERHSLTYKELDAIVRSTAVQILERCAPGDRALMIYPPGLEYIAALYACMYAGVIAVPAYTPRPNRPLSRIEAIIANAKPTVVLTTQELLDSPRSIFLQKEGPLARLPRIATDEISLDPAATVSVKIKPEMPVILQYTSGSTASPKGVTLTHRNILFNTAAIERNFPLDSQSSTVFWLPPYHDMGLIGGILQPLCTGFPVTLLSPVAFLQRPVRWLQAISNFRATCSGGPNFAYDLCTRRISEEEINGLDLSSWSVAFNGAEPIRKQTLDDFSKKFARCGFRRSSFHPCYGLAETTLMATGMDRSGTGLQFQSVSRITLEKGEAQAPIDSSDECWLVSSGRAAENQNVRVVDPDTAKPLPAENVGEVWVSGPGVAAGYWGRAEETEETFHARLANGDGPFLRTGDLGFMREGQLYITGRIKDLIIIRGQNYYAHDLEFTAQRSHPALNPSSSAAFSIQQDGVERLILAQEVDGRRNAEDLREILNCISSSISETYDLRVDEIILVKPFTLPRTTSGKMQRYLCRAAYLSGSLQKTQPRTEGQPSVASEQPATAESATSLAP
jgi:acyl-CoA synthetase (AMP-forming)/AMP-acid ligase II